MTIAINGIWHSLLMAVATEYNERRELERRFNEILRLHDNLILRLCYGYAATAAELDDLHQNVLINIWQGLPKFRGESSLKTWIYRVTLNTCVSTIRSRYNRAETLPMAAVVDTTDESEEQKNLLLELHEAISQLSSVDRAIILLWLDDMSYDEISALTGLSRSAVGIRIHRAKDKLRQFM